MMANPLIHTLVFIAAVVIPGGLLVYLAWRACDARRKAKEESSGPPPEQARLAFLAMYPKDSLRPRLGLARLDFYKSRPRKKS
jgi:threonine/homoserine/homoserine lactone efflux protein